MHERVWCVMGITRVGKGNGFATKNAIVCILILIVIAGGLLFWVFSGNKGKVLPPPKEPSPTPQPIAKPDEYRWSFREERVALDTMVKSAKKITAFDRIATEIEEEAVAVLGRDWECSPGTQLMQNELYVVYRGLGAIALKIDALKKSASQQIVKDVFSIIVTEQEDLASKQFAEKIKNNTHKSIEARAGIKKTIGLPPRIEGGFQTRFASELSKESIDVETKKAISNLTKERKERIKTITKVSEIDASLIEAFVEFRMRLLGLRIELQRAFLAEPKWLPSYRDGNASMRQDEWNSAIKHYSFAASTCGVPGNRIMLNVLLADALRRAGKNDEAVKLLEEERRDKNADLPLEGYTVLGRGYIDAKKNSEAQKILEIPWHEKLKRSADNPLLKLRENIRTKYGFEDKGLPEYSWMIWLAEAYLQEASTTDNKEVNEDRINKAAKAIRFALGKLHEDPKKLEPYWKFAAYARNCQQIRTTEACKALPVKLNVVIRDKGWFSTMDEIIFTNASGHLGENDEKGEGLDKDRYAFALTNTVITLRLYEADNEKPTSVINITAGDRENAGGFGPGQEWTCDKAYYLLDGWSKVTMEVSCDQGCQEETKISQ